METIMSWPPFKTDRINPKFKCHLCKEVYVNVYQADDCGCRFCYNCLNSMSQNKKVYCPNCNFKFASYVSVLIVYLFFLVIFKEH